jgi:RNA polymerase-binding transcription factor DksA
MVGNATGGHDGRHQLERVSHLLHRPQRTRQLQHPETGRATHASFTKGTTVHQKIDSVRPSNSAVLELQLPAIQAELDKQRGCRIEQVDELTVDATEAAATRDECMLQVTRVLQVAAESAVGEIEPALERLGNGSYGICERCTEPIQFERLEALPMTRLCTPCQYLAESGRSRTCRPSNTLSASWIR